MKHSLQKNWVLHLLTAILSLVIFIPYLGNVHLFDWDEINFAEAAREMIITGDWLRVQIDYAPFWEKPPLFIWLQALSMLIFGVNEFAARFPNALLGVITLQVLLALGRKIHSNQFGISWVIAYACSFLPHFYFRSGIIDPLFNLAIFLSVYFLYKTFDENKTSFILFAGFSTGVAILTKGPVGLLLPSLVVAVMVVLQRRFSLFTLRSGIVYLIVSIIVASLWFGIEFILHGPWFIEEFIRYQIRLLTTGDAGHSQPFYYHFVVVLIGCFPASIYAVFAGKHAWSEGAFSFSRWMIILLSVVMILFSLVQTKIVHYSSLAYFPVTYLAALMMSQLVNSKENKVWPLVTAYLFFSIVWIGLFTALWYIGTHIQAIIALTKRDFEKATLTAPVIWSGFEIIVPFLLLCGFLLYSMFIYQKKYERAILTGYLSVLLSICIFLPLVAPKIEGYTQNSIIGFYQKTGNENCYVQPIFYKTYAHLFYGRRKSEQSPSSKGMTSGEFEEWLKKGDIDKPVYFIAKIHDKNHLEEIQNAQFYGSYHGFLVYKRFPD